MPLEDIVAVQVDQQLLGVPRPLALSKLQRVSLVSEVLTQLPRARFDMEAIWLLCITFKLVEDRCTGAEFRADGSNHNDRMYGPSRQQLKASPVWEFWAKRHIILVGVNGAMRITGRDAQATLVLNLPGSDDQFLP